MEDIELGIAPIVVLVIYLCMMIGIGLHGLCFGCFIFVAFMIVDEECSGDVRASAQSLFNLVIVGVGTIIGSKIAATIAGIYSENNKIVDYRGLFSWPMWGSVACIVVLWFFYPNKKPLAVGTSPVGKPEEGVDRDDDS